MLVSTRVAFALIFEVWPASRLTSELVTVTFFALVFFDFSPATRMEAERTRVTLEPL